MLRDRKVDQTRLDQTRLDSSAQNFGSLKIFARVEDPKFLGSKITQIKMHMGMNPGRHAL